MQVEALRFDVQVPGQELLLTGGAFQHDVDMLAVDFQLEFIRAVWTQISPGATTSARVGSLSQPSHQPIRSCPLKCPHLWSVWTSAGEQAV